MGGPPSPPPEKSPQPTPPGRIRGFNNFQFDLLITADDRSLISKNVPFSFLDTPAILRSLNCGWGPGPAQIEYGELLVQCNLISQYGFQFFSGYLWNNGSPCWNGELILTNLEVLSILCSKAPPTSGAWVPFHLQISGVYQYI
jgi:hypothetical protein